MSEGSDIRVSVVIAASGGPMLLERCLSSLREQTDLAGMEVIVASNYAAGAIAAFMEQLPFVSFFPLAAGTTVPQLRAHGIAQSRGAVVVLSEDNCMFASDWHVCMRGAHDRLSHVAIGGAVDNRSGTRLTDWAVYFYEYGRFMSPNKAGPVDALAGNHLSYKRTVLQQLDGHYRNGFYETFFHQELCRQGYTLYMEPSAIVYHIRSYAAADVIKKCYHHGRAFAAMRVAEARRTRRLALALGSLLLPVLLTGRVAWRVSVKRRHLLELMLALPHLSVFMTSWACGELLGYLAGPGESAGQWS